MNWETLPYSVDEGLRQKPSRDSVYYVRPKDSQPRLLIHGDTEIPSGTQQSNLARDAPPSTNVRSDFQRASERYRAHSNPGEPLMQGNYSGPYEQELQIPRMTESQHLAFLGLVLNQNYEQSPTASPPAFADQREPYTRQAPPSRHEPRLLDYFITELHRESSLGDFANSQTCTCSISYSVR